MNLKKYLAVLLFFYLSVNDLTDGDWVMAGAGWVRACRDDWSSPIWGDGFAQDHWSSRAFVLLWNTIHSDEAVFFFPNLPDADPRSVRAQLTSRCMRAGARRSVGDATARFVATILDSVMFQADALDTEMLHKFSFATGFNAANFMKNGAIFHETMMVSAWLGQWAQNRQLLMTPAIAEPFVTMESSDDDRNRIREFAGGESRLRYLLRQAEICLATDDHVVLKRDSFTQAVQRIGDRLGCHLV